MTEGKGDDTYLRTAFLERVAHELRGPAGVIHGALQELEAALEHQPAGDHEVFLAMAKRGLRRILRTADRLQNTGTLERGAPELSPSSCDLIALVKQAVNEAQIIEGRKKVSIEIDAPTAAPCVLDGHWMSLALFELASNAIRHSNERMCVAVKAEPAGGYSVTFTDDARTSVEFGPARFRPTRDSRGLGLGLSIASDVFAAHGCALHTDYGRTNGQEFGARVSVTIPAV